MSEPTVEQQASADLARTVFADPELRAKFELMAKDADSRDPVLDDFAWLSKDEFSRLELATRRLIGSAIQSRDDDRTSLHGIDPTDALRALLRTPPAKG